GRVEPIDVIAVVGSCAPERQGYAARFAGLTHRMLIPATRLEATPDPVEEATMLAPWCNHPAGVVIEFPHAASMIDIVGALAEADGSTTLSGVICVVDAAHLLADLACRSCSTHPALTRLMGRAVPHALITVNQIEFASMIVLSNWEGLETDELSVVMALLSHLSPFARLRVDHGGLGWSGGEEYTPEQVRPGWVALVNGVHDPHMTDPRVSAFRYENLRPLHPVRLARLLDERIEPGEFGTVIRSMGFCRLATRPYAVAEWNHVGGTISFDPLGRDDALGDDEELLALGQDIGIIGLDLDRVALGRALDEAALTDAELAAGIGEWVRYDDPFPAWRSVVEDAE
ncbi:MAG TPA: GTP-binding protein, partial [Microbacterium sp.]|nr:GTP-binding protein [Microbacterium sp.]